VDTLLGDRSLCDVRCMHSPRPPDLQRQDGCCGAGANANTDLDCSPACGNGVVENGESCDGNCPTQEDCEDGDPCTLDTVSGVDCRRECSRVPAVLGSNDGCCLSGESWQDDLACPRTYSCGDRCSATDDVSTPGDERAGYVTCGAASCAPDTFCFAPIGAIAKCVPDHLGWNVVVCDGKEDCSIGELCYQVSPEIHSGGTGCGKPVTVDARASECHGDVDCGAGLSCVPNPAPNRPWSVYWCASK
jgi:hypothetical protein